MFLSQIVLVLLENTHLKSVESSGTARAYCCAGIAIFLVKMLKTSCFGFRSGIRARACLHNAATVKAHLKHLSTKYTRVQSSDFKRLGKVDTANGVAGISVQGIRSQRYSKQRYSKVQGIRSIRSKGIRMACFLDKCLRRVFIVAAQCKHFRALTPLLKPKQDVFSIFTKK